MKSLKWLKLEAGCGSKLDVKKASMSYYEWWFNPIYCLSIFCAAVNRQGMLLDLLSRTRYVVLALHYGRICFMYLDVTLLGLCLYFDFFVNGQGLLG